MVKHTVVINIQGGIVQSVVASGETLVIIVDEDMEPHCSVWQEPAEICKIGECHKKFNEPFKKEVKYLESKRTKTEKVSP